MQEGLCTEVNGTHGTLADVFLVDLLYSFRERILRICTFLNVHVLILNITLVDTTS